MDYPMKKRFYSIGHSETTLFAPEIVSFYITITPADWERIQQQRPRRGNRRETVKGRVRYKNEIYQDVGLQFQGSSSFRASIGTLKRPFVFDLGQFLKGQTLHGHGKLNFKNGFKDPSLMREKLAYDLFHKAGVPAPKAAYARLYLTVEGKYEQEYLGLYTMVEQLDRRFLKARFGNGDGLLVEPDHIPDLLDRGDDWKSYAQNYELKSKKETSDTARLLEFLKFLNYSDDNRFAQDIEGFFNVDSFLRSLAVNTLLVNLDSYMGVGHNYYLYHNTATGQYEMIPLDLNEAFGSFQMGSNAEQIVSLDINQPSAGRKVLIDRLLNIPKYKVQYHQYLRDLIKSHFNPNAMFDEIDQLYYLIHNAVVTDKHKQFSTDMFEKSIYENVTVNVNLWQSANREERTNREPFPSLVEIIGLKPFVAKRVEFVKAQLNGEQRGYIVQPPKHTK